VTHRELPPGFHKCAVRTCNKSVHNRYLMCPRHWCLVPQHIATAIYREYHYGMRRGIHPTREYAAQVQAALDHIASKEGEQLSLA
jgi:hypothetical protein